MKTCIYFLVAVITMLAAACSKPAPVPQKTTSNDGRRVYEVRGIVRGAITGANTVSIEHEDIPGFMPSMTMPFEFKERREINGINTGDAVRFNLVVTDNASWIEQVKKISPAAVHLPENTPVTTAGENVPRLNEGDIVPEFKLKDQQGRELTRETFAGKTVLFTFIFTRCPLPNYCPRISRNFADLQHSILADPAMKDRVQLISISFDPEHDSPEVLALYASAFTKNGDSWRFATGSKEEIAKLTHEFSVYIQEENGTYSHGLCTVMVAPNGVIQKIWRGNDWEVADALGVLHSSIVTR